MNTTGYRVTFTLLAVALLVIIAGAILFIPSGDPEQLPSAVDQYAPHDGDIALNPVQVMIDVQPNYEVTFIIDGVPIPASEVDAIVATGRYQFEPGDGKAIEFWTPGEHTVVASWIGGTAGTDAGTLVWTFRLQ
jgi:hypothetical protein